MKYCFMLIAFLSFALCSAQDEPVNFMELPDKPTYPGGIKKFYDYVNKSIKAPQVDDDMTLNITLSFVVETNGSLSEVTVLKDPGYGVGADAKKVVEACPEKWIPGKVNNQPVRARYILPIKILVQASSPETEETPAKD